MSGRRDLPPLNAVKAFEASARLGGFVAAARELGVTPAAISLQVRNLEEHLGVALFERRSNGVTLTGSGEAAFRDCAGALESLTGLAARMRDEVAGPRLVVSAMPSLAFRWLAPALGRFHRAEPDIRIELREEADPVSFGRDQIDVRIAYGAHLYPEFSSTPLFRDALEPMMAPRLLATRGIDPARPASLPDDLLIHGWWWASMAAYPTWSDWFARAGVPREPARERGHAVGMTSVALDFAVAGIGVALGQKVLAASEIAAGTLVAPFGHVTPLPHPYAVVIPRARLGRRPVRRLVDWLVEEVRAVTEAAGLGGAGSASGR